MAAEIGGYIVVGAMITILKKGKSGNGIKKVKM
jgi:hypothetical protein